MKAPLLELLPLPRYHRLLKRSLSLPEDSQLDLQAPAGFNSPGLERLRGLLAERGVELIPGAQGTTQLTLELREQASPSPEAYQLSVLEDGIQIEANQAAGLRLGLYTLCQWIAARLDHRRQLQGIEIEDQPSFPERGVMLDISRDRVPTMQTLRSLVEELASLKYNRIQLYTEHTFAYPAHPEVWAGWDPITPEEMRALDAHCTRHGIELVPNQQSFGHMHHWLRHPSLAHLAECPEGIEHPFSTDREPFGLCCEDPASLEFLDKLYAQLLPNFASETLNVGCDETLDLGLGRSKKACEKNGTGHAYLKFIESIHGLLAKRSKRMQFWADIILNYPELVPELPKRLPGATAMIWGYEADHPFERETRLVAESGLDFYVCPGTSAWQSIAGRFENMVANLASAALHGQANGAKGFLVTDWGDRGHLQPLSSCFPAWAMGSDLAWNHLATPARHDAAGLGQLLSQHFLQDPTAASGQAMVSLARVSARVNNPWHNASPLSLLITKALEPFPPKELEALTPAGLEQGSEMIESALCTLKLHQMARPNAAQVLAEMNWGAELMGFAIQLGQARLAAEPGQHLRELPLDAREPLAARLAPLIEEHARLWRSQHRQGGLMRSSKWLEDILAGLNAET